MSILKELRQRQVPQLVGLYVVGAWVVIEVASVFFPAWDIPDTALRYLFIAAAVLFPVVLLFGWLFDVRRGGVFRTTRIADGEISAVALGRRDFALLGALTAVTAAVLLLTLVQVWNATDSEPAAVTDVSRVAENSVAVLPFSNMDPNPNTDFFSDGVADEILHQLARTRQIDVKGRNASFAFRDSGLDPAAICAALGVSHLLEGSVRRDGDLVRVTASLLDRAGKLIWTEAFDRQRQDIFAIQAEIATSVAGQIVAEIVTSGDGGAQAPTDNLEAYDEYLIGRKYTHDRAGDWRTESQAAFRRAIELDPEFAGAWAGLAYSLVIMQRGECDEDCWYEALAAAERSIELDPELAEGHAIYGNMNWSVFGELAKGEEHLRLALELDPSIADTYNWLSWLFFQTDRADEAEAMLARGNRIDDTHAPIAANYSALLSRRGDFDGAVRAVRRLARLPNPPHPAVGALEEVYFEWGRYRDVIEFSRTDNYDVVALAALGLDAEADARIASLKETDPDFATRTAAHVARMRGQHDLATSSLEEIAAVQQVGPEDLPPGLFIRYLLAKALTGDTAFVIGTFESQADATLGDPIFNEYAPRAQELLNTLAWSFQRQGDVAAASRILDHEVAELERRQPVRAPYYLEPLAQRAALQGDDDEAYRLMSLAVEQGWANYREAMNDARWGDTLQQPRFVELFATVQENLAAQRAEVEAFLETTP